MNLDQMVEATRQYREKLLKDPYRPRYHFCVPDGDGVPGDPNGYFYADGRHHLMYLYRRDKGPFHWGHVSSTDLLFWRHHEDCLVKGEKDGGCFSGGAFVDDDKTAYLTYWIFNEDDTSEIQGIGLAKSVPPYEKWEQIEKPIIQSTCNGIIENINGVHLGCADPSNIWKVDDCYYVQAGNKCVLDKYGREEDSPEMYQGDWTELFSSKNLLDWTFEGRFYDRFEGDRPDKSEDDMCPSFLLLPMSQEGGELSEKYLQLFISHNRGCQYYIGTLKDKKFEAESHGRMSWVDDTFFAPEAALDDKNRQIMFAWLRDDLPNQYRDYGWSGVFGLPRSLWLREDGTLGIAPVSELKRLRGKQIEYAAENLQGEEKVFDLESPECCEIYLDVQDPHEKVEISVMMRESGERVVVFYDPGQGNLCVDAQESGSASRAVVETAPLKLAEGENLALTIYIDKSVIEVFANDRQAITRRIYNPDQIVPSFKVSAKDQINELKSWQMMPSMPY